MTTGAEEEVWFLGEIRGSDTVHFVRSLRVLPPAPKRADMSKLIIIRWPYDVTESGMPDAAALGRMDEFRDRLTDAVEPTGIAMEVASLTGEGVREWRFYTIGPDEFMKALNEALAGSEVLPIDLQFFEDPDWDALDELLPRG